MKTNHLLSTVHQAVIILAIVALGARELQAAPRRAPVVHAVTKADAKDSLESADTEFAFSLLNELANETPGSNIFISPYSASTALQMTASGAAGSTSAEMQSTLGTAGLAPLALYQASKELNEQLNTGDTNVVLMTANSLWYLNGFPIEQGFLMDNADYFGAKVAGLDFSEQSSVDAINAWASKETLGKINQIVTFPLDPNLRVLLANAVYFHGNWQYAFDSSQTTTQPFFLADGSNESVPMMQQTTNFDYYATDNYQAIRLPYQGSNVAMYVFLPTGQLTLQDLMKTISAQWWEQSVGTFFANSSGTIALPKFSLNSDIYLNQPLINLGMLTAFTPAANFSKISTERLHISYVKQQAIIEVDEKGTVATAVTTVGVTSSAISSFSPFEMIVDHPFLFVIEDRQAATILFMGAVYAP